jgi:hypothetical protein
LPLALSTAMLSTAAPAPVAVAENATVPSKPQTDENANPYISLIQKRLRNFKKRMVQWRLLSYLF